MNKGESLALSAQASFKGAVLQTNFSYASSNVDVVIVSEDGVITSVGYGTATVTVSTVFAGKEWTTVEIRWRWTSYRRGLGRYSRCQNPSFCRQWGGGARL
jgi:uncharacterized protein YjdB